MEREAHHTWQHDFQRHIAGSRSWTLKDRCQDGMRRPMESHHGVALELLSSDVAAQPDVDAVVNADNAQLPPVAGRPARSIGRLGRV